MSLFNIKNKTILITGASSGIGKEIAFQCSEAGANVIIVGRNEERLNSILNQLNPSSKSYFCDLSKEENIRDLVNVIPQLDGVVFCAGVVEYNPIKFINLNKINNIFSINLNSQMLLTQQLVKNKKLNPNSSLVYISLSRSLNYISCHTVVVKLIIVMIIVRMMMTRLIITVMIRLVTCTKAPTTISIQPILIIPFSSFHPYSSTSSYLLYGH
jgi:enoyl-[acyl-carrier-protein] reductase (NADH)